MLPLAETGSFPAKARISSRTPDGQSNFETGSGGNGDGRVMSGVAEIVTRKNHTGPRKTRKGLAHVAWIMIRAEFHSIPGSRKIIIHQSI